MIRILPIAGLLLLTACQTPPTPEQLACLMDSAGTVVGIVRQAQVTVASDANKAVTATVVAVTTAAADPNCAKAIQQAAAGPTKP